MSYIYGVHRTRFGDFMIAINLLNNKLISGEFATKINNHNLKEFLNAILKIRPGINIQQNQKKTAPFVNKLFNTFRNPIDIEPELLGTPFQVKVWKELLNIPYGTTVCYQDIANKIDNPQAVRAVASSIANNRIAYLIPCHRVIKKSGETHKYRWGSEIKQSMIEWEQNNLDTI